MLSWPVLPEDRTQGRLTELEIKASFSEDMLDQLNQVVTRQQREIDALLRAVAELRNQLAHQPLGGATRPVDELPPHY